MVDREERGNGKIKHEKADTVLSFTICLEEPRAFDTGKHNLCLTLQDTTCL